MEIIETKTGTIIVGSIEYNEFPPPTRLVKTMSRHWAQELVNKGLLRIRHLDFFRAWENAALGDPNDGNGIFHLDGHPMNTGSVNDVYAWCSSFPNINKERISLFVEQSDYDCMLVINNPQLLFQKISHCLSKTMPGFLVHCGAVHYNRGEGVDKSTLNSQKFHFNVFQKSGSFSEDIEYRMSVTKTNFETLEEKYIDLNLGDCSDLLSIEELPNK